MSSLYILIYFQTGPTSILLPQMPLDLINIESKGNIIMDIAGDHGLILYLLFALDILCVYISMNFFVHALHT